MRIARQRSALVRARITARKFADAFDEFGRVMFDAIADGSSFRDSMAALRDSIVSTLSSLVWAEIGRQETAKVRRLERLFPVVIPKDPT